MSNTSETKPKQTKSKKYMLVRYGRMNALAFFEHHETEIPKVHSRVVVKTERGLELGHIVGRLCSYRGGQFRLKEEQIKEYFEKSDIDFLVEAGSETSRWFPAGLILDLEELLGCKVDVVTQHALHWYIRERIIKEAVPL